MIFTADQLRQCMPHCPPDRVEDYALLLGAEMTAADIDTVARAACFLGQLAHESGDLRFLEELLTYTADQLVRLWPRRFTLLDAVHYVGNPERIANRAYAGRMGNGDEASGDGWRYRGRGWIQLSLRDNYRWASTVVGVDLVAEPDRAAEPAFAAKIAAAYWRDHGCSQFADAWDIPGVTRQINKALDGLLSRQLATERARNVLERTARLA